MPLWEIGARADRHGGMQNRIQGAAVEVREPLVLTPEEELAYEQRDLRTVAWRFLAAIRHDRDYIKLAAPAASMMRVILALGEEPEDRAAAIAETDVIGSVLHGMAPRTAAQWAIAESVYDAATIEDLRHWRESSPEGERYRSP
jgi:hypothetical protein